MIVSQNQPLRTVRINALMSTPQTPQNSRLPKMDKLERLTSHQKVEQYGDMLIFQAIPFQKQAINCISPCNHETGEVAPGAGRTHTIRWDARKGRWVCSCEAEKVCWHLMVLEVNLYGFIECGTISFSASAPVASHDKPSVYSVADNKTAGFGSPEAFKVARKADYDL